VVKGSKKNFMIVMNRNLQQIIVKPLNYLSKLYGM
jgi:hypothetical protein